MTLEELDKVLVHKNIDVMPVTEEDGKLNRKRTFIVEGQVYTIEWWVNICYLRTGGLMVCFDYVIQSGTWPHMYKLNLQFKDNSGDTLAVIGIEKY